MRLGVPDDGEEEVRNIGTNSCGTTVIGGTDNGGIMPTLYDAAGNRIF
ncbi:MAG: hypothetical protein R2793_08965 [Flavobacteriaceae bacterium]